MWPAVKHYRMICITCIFLVTFSNSAFLYLTVLISCHNLRICIKCTRVTSCLDGRCGYIPQAAVSQCQDSNCRAKRSTFLLYWLWGPSSNSRHFTWCGAWGLCIEGIILLHHAGWQMPALASMLMVLIVQLVELTLPMFSRYQPCCRITCYRKLLPSFLAQKG